MKFRKLTTFKKILLLTFVGMLTGCLWSSTQISSEQKDAGTGSVTALPYYNTPEFTPRWSDNQSFDLSKMPKIKPFAFQNQNGETVTNETLKDKIYLTNFFFTICPGICPKMTGNFALLQDEFQDMNDVVLVSHTVMPWVDSVSVLRNYANNYEVQDGKWHLLTGKKETIFDLARTSYYAEKGIGLQKSSDEFLHTENALLIDKNGRIRGVYNATLESEVKRIVEDVALLRSE